MVRILFVLCEPQIKERGLEPEQFGEGFNGEALAAAADALVEEIVLFFRPHAREPLHKLIAKGKTLASLAAAKLSEEIDGVDVQALLNQSMKSSGDAPASLASNPDHSHFGN